MAPNKRKKKVPNNPDRGFATTSTASKPKSQTVPDTHLEPGPEMKALADESQSHSGTVRDLTVSGDLGVPLSELSPGELEKELEESELQNLVEMHGEKSKKEVARQVSRLNTEHRLLRTQAEHLETSQWLLSELMQHVMEQLDLHEERTDESQKDRSAQKVSSSFSEEDLLIKLWTLHRLLPRLGFTHQRCQWVLLELLRSSKMQDTQTESVPKDSIWGLDSCLERIAKVSEPREMLGRDYGQQAAAVARTARTNASSPDDSRPTTPLHTHEMEPQITMSCVDGTSDSPSSQSESDSNVEPDEMITRFLALQSRLYQIDPELVNNRSKQRNSKGKSRDNIQCIDKSSSPNVARAYRKIAKIRSDILFDNEEAERRWEDIRIQLARDVAERRRLDIETENKVDEVMTMDKPVEENRSTDSVSEDEGLGALLGELFSTLPDTTIVKGTGASTMNVPNSDGVSIAVRDFGRWSGISPRRVLEEACKARDSLSKISYKLISESTFSNRHLVRVQWSRSQNLSLSPPIDSVSCDIDDRSINLEMISISCPDEVQSEAYISTLMLFLIFASSPREEKAHLRLPPTWRDFWRELAQLRKEKEDGEDREILRGLRNSITQSICPDVTLHENGATMEVNSTKKYYSEGRPAPSGDSSPTAVSESIKTSWELKASSNSYRSMLTSRILLPIWKFKSELLEAITDNQVVIICGETGCGKSTQVPTYILEHELSNGRACEVYCTEPRRISAISLARRVSEELGESKGDVGTSRSVVGYAIRLESQITNQTKLVYATTGIVMRMLERSDTLEDITHLILDEVHERSIDSDFLLLVLRKLLIRRPHLKVVLMSATVDTQRFSNYLSQAPVLNVPGRTFPVETKFLEDVVEITKFNFNGTQRDGISAEECEEDYDNISDAATNSTAASSLKTYSANTRETLASLDEYRINYDLVVRLLETVATVKYYAEYSKAILVFLPGIAEIRRLNDMLLGHRSFAWGWNIHALHSSIAMEEQERAFLLPPKGMRKIVLATNIAETGITIPDVTCVIDTGKHKEMRFDEKRQLSRLIESFISRANAKQRRGRAGRVQNGLCFHLFTKDRHDNIMSSEQTPEMLRLSLQDLVLRVKICKLGGIEETLAEALDPPSARNVRRAIDALVDVKALTASEDLTSLGRRLAGLPLDVFLGKLILLGSIFGCLDAALTIAAILSSKSPFSAPMGARSQADLARMEFRKGDSDLLTVYNAYCAWRRICSTNGMSEQQFCRKNFLSPQTLSNIEELKGQLMASLVDAGFVTLTDVEKTALKRVRFHSRQRNFVSIPSQYDTNNANILILNSVIAWSFYPKLLIRVGKGWRNVANNQTVSLHPTSVNKGIERPPRWLSFYHIMQSSNKFYNAHETSAVEDFAIALLCGDADFKMYSGCIVIDGNRIRYSLDDWKILLVIKTLRIQFRTIMAQAFKTPGRQLSERQAVWMDIWRRMFTREEKVGVGGTGRALGAR